MIDSIEITNWKTHKKTAMNFQKGVNVLIGVMGAGKSSTIDAISFGLFGTFPALQSKRITLSGLITNRPKQEEEAEVKLKFSTDNDEYVVTRKIGSSGNSARLDKNGSYFQTQATKVTEEIEQALKLDYDTFARVVYAEQNRLDYFLELPKSERKKQIDHMLGLDAFATAEENATTLINSMKSAMAGQEDALSRFDIAVTRKELKKLSDERDDLAKEKERSQKEEKKIKEELERLKKEYEASKKQLAQKKSISEEIVGMQSRIKKINEEIKKIETMKIEEQKVRASIDSLEVKDKALSKTIDELKKKERACSKELADYEANAKVNKKKLADRDKIIADIKDSDQSKTKKELDKETEELQELAKEVAAKRGKIKELGEWVAELTKHISKCPVCERELGDEMREKLLEGKKSAMDALAGELKKAERATEEKDTRIKRLHELHNKLLLANTRLIEFKDLDKAIDANEKELKSSQKQLKEIQDEYEAKAKEHESVKESLASARSDMQTAERRKSYEKEAKDAESELQKKRKEFDAIEVDEKALYETQDNITKHSSLLSDISSRLQGHTKLLESMDSQIGDKEKRVKEFEKIEKEIAKRQGQVLNLNKFKMALIDTEAILRNRLVSSINNLMQGLWPQLYPYGDYTSIRLNAKKDDYLLEVNTGSAENWITVDGIASGGERSVGCLAMRIALAMVVVPNLRWLILDEPTHNIDSAGIAKLIEVLGEALPSIVEQIFIITHDDNLKQISSAKVYQLERDKASGAPTSVAEL